MKYKPHDRVSESEPVSSDLPYYLKENKVGFMCHWLDFISLWGDSLICPRRTEYGAERQGMVLQGPDSLKKGIQFHYLPSSTGCLFGPEALKLALRLAMRGLHEWFLYLQKEILSRGVSLKKVSSCEKRNELGS